MTIGSPGMIRAEGVVYDYPGFRALNGVSFTLEAGEALALVGPNGAGKSTLMRCLAALDAPTSGRIEVAGRDTQSHPREVHAAIGYLADFYGLYEDLSVERCVLYAARSRGVSAAAAPAAALRALERVGLADRRGARAGALSRGLRQRLAIAQSLVHEPKVLLLDEPAAGLDPEARADLSSLLRGLAADGVALVISSHILSELEHYSTRMLMLRDGRAEGGGLIVAGSGGPARSAPADLTEVEFDPAPPDLATRLAGLGVRVRRLEGDRAEIEGGGAELLARLVGAGLPVSRYEPRRRTLEAAYLAEARAAPPDAGPWRVDPAPTGETST